MLFTPWRRLTELDQLDVPVAGIGTWPLTLIKTPATPEPYGCGSVAVPAKLIRLLLTQRPLNGGLTITTGALVSGRPPGTMASRIEPSELASILATAMR